jgi:hypothetical protein
MNRSGRGWLLFGAVATFSALAVAAQGCTITTGDGLDGGDFNGSDGSVPDVRVPPDAGDGPCFDCIVNTCRAQWALCKANSDCIAISTCSNACNGNGPCIEKCYTDRPQGHPAYDALYLCNRVYECSSCKGVCRTPEEFCRAPVPDAGGGVDAATPDAGETPDAGGTTDAGTAVDPCTTCSETQCASESAACASGTQCDQYTKCLAACADANCITKCGTDYPNGASTSAALAGCVTGKCAVQCGLQ